MSTIAWIVVLLWPLFVVVIYMHIVDGTLKDRAKFITDNFNLVGKALLKIDKSMEEINLKLDEHKAEIDKLSKH